jgi:hypothetical protein
MWVACRNAVDEVRFLGPYSALALARVSDCRGAVFDKVSVLRGLVNRVRKNVCRVQGLDRRFLPPIGDHSGRNHFRPDSPLHNVPKMTHFRAPIVMVRSRYFLIPGHC